MWPRGKFLGILDMYCLERPEIKYNSFMHVKYQIQQIKEISMRVRMIFHTRFLNIFCIFFRFMKLINKLLKFQSYEKLNQIFIFVNTFKIIHLYCRQQYYT